MSERRTSERLLVPAESLDRIDPLELATPLDMSEETQPMRLSFLALLAESDPVVQSRLERWRTLSLENDLDEDEDRPTDPMVMFGR